MPPELVDMDTSESTGDFEVSELENSSKLKKKQKVGIYVCCIPGCGERFNRLKKLDRHEYMHTDVKKHVCPYKGCKKNYTIIQHLKRHIKESHKEMRVGRNVKCLIENCKKKFDYVCNMEKHIRDVHEKLYPCPTCPSQFKRKFQLRKHLVMHTGEYPFKCTNCQKGFLYKALYHKHCCDPKEYKCDLCQKVFQKWTLLVSHKRTDHVILHKCNQCEKEFKRKEYLKQHMEKHKSIEEREVLQCPWTDCTRYYYHARNLTKHIRTNHEGLKYKCPIEGCEKSLVSKQKLDLHVKLHKIGSKIPKNKNPEEVKKTRSDKGKKKKSYASTLAGVILKPEVEKLILNGQGKNIHVEVTSSDIDVTTDTDDEIAISKRVVLLDKI